MQQEWFAGLRTEEAKHQRCFWRRVGFGLAALIILSAIALLAGCASGKEAKEDEPRICFLKSMGRTEDGMVVVAQHCMSQEAFQEMQK